MENYSFERRKNTFKMMYNLKYCFHKLKFNSSFVTIKSWKFKNKNKLSIAKFYGDIKPQFDFPIYIYANIFGGSRNLLK